MPNVLLQRLDAAHIYADISGISNASARDRIINIYLTDKNGYSSWDSIEELFVHELVHASLDKPRYGAYKPINKIRHKSDTSKSVKLNWSHWRKAVKRDKKNMLMIMQKQLFMKIWQKASCLGWLFVIVRELQI